MPERRLARTLEIAAVAVLFVLAILGLTLLPLTTPLYVRTLVKVVDSQQLTGLGPEATLEAAETVRRFVLDADAPALPETIAGRPAFDEAASAHLVDVRDVLVPARALGLLAALGALGWTLLRRKDRLLRAAVARAAGAGVLGAIALAALVGLVDFDGFFAWFHSLFFASGTWMFPADALIILVFPLPFWMAAAATWAVLVLMSCALSFIYAYHLSVTHGQTVYSHGGA